MAYLDITIKAKQFNPQDAPWPKGVIPWTKEDIQPRDCSWGYVECKSGKVHIFAGDYTITILKKMYIVREANFPAFKKHLEDTYKREFKKLTKKEMA